MPDELTPEQIEAQKNADAEAKAKADALAAEREKSNITDREADLLKEVMAKKETARAAQAAADAAEAKAKELADRLAAFDGIDLDEVKGLLKEKQERELSDLEKRGEFERVKAQMAEAHQRDVEAAKAAYEPKVAELTEALNKREQVITELTIGRSFSESTFIRDSLALPVTKTRVLYGAHFELQDGKIVGYDKPAGATDRTPLVDANGNFLDFDKAMEKIVEGDPDRDNLLKSKIRGGSGSHNDPNITAEDKNKKPLTGRERILAAVSAGQLPKLPGRA